MVRKYILFLSVSISVIFTSCGDNEVITVFHAGSLSVPFQLAAEQYERMNPGVKVQLEGAGSLACIRKITELDKPCDVLAVADYALIDELMIPEHASHNILFARNELAIGYRKGSGWDQKLNNSNWHEVLLQNDVHYGRSDPNHDPSGYRTEIMAGLAEKQFQVRGLQKKLLAKDRKFIRPKGTEVLPLLEVEAIDFIFHYRSVLIQHDLEFLALPDSLNLGDPGLNDWYASVCVEVDGKTPQERILKCGEAMVYGICLPDNGKNKKGAEEFITFLLTEGREILEEEGQPIMKPTLSKKSLSVPDWFSTLNF